MLFGIRYSVVCPWSVRQFTFSTSPEPLNGFWWNLVWMKYSRSLTNCCFLARSTQGADPGWGQNSSQRVSCYSNKLNVHLYSNDLKELEEVLLFLVPFRSLVFDTFWCHVLDLAISTYFLSNFFNWVVGECLCKRFICLIHVRKIYWLCSTSALRSYCINHQEFCTCELLLLQVQIMN